MKILKLTIKKKWFDMIKSGEKKEEYREIKDYWKKRLLERKIENGIVKNIVKDYDYIHFFNGAYFSEKLPNFKIEYNALRVGSGLEKWGAVKEKLYLCLILGKLL